MRFQISSTEDAQRLTLWDVLCAGVKRPVGLGVSTLFMQIYLLVPGCKETQVPCFKGYCHMEWNGERLLKL
jgi:hypothetical protein